MPRERLWQVLATKGVTGYILACLQSIYDQDQACVLTPEGLTDSFRCTKGVKQGCPASPLLFGPYIDALETLLQAASQEIDAPTLLHALVAILLFADDIALLSYSPEGLQKQLDILQDFCFSNGLTVNVSKTKVVIFERKQASAPPFTYQGEAIERVQSF